jgi:circadian clock protein KaiC
VLGSIPFGISAFDEILGGGLAQGTSTVVAGSPGTGKTLLSMHFIAEGVRRNEPSLLVEFVEDSAQLRAQARMFGFDSLFDESSNVMEFPAYEMEADLIAHQIIDVLDQKGIRRLVIDSATELQRAIDPIRQADFFAALIDELRARNITTLFTFDVPTVVGSDLTFANSPLAVLAENLILLRQVEANGRLERSLAVLKLRFGVADQAFHSYSIRPPQGIEVLANVSRSDDPNGSAVPQAVPGANLNPANRHGT